MDQSDTSSSRCFPVARGRCLWIFRLQSIIICFILTVNYDNIRRHYYTFTERQFDLKHLACNDLKINAHVRMYISIPVLCYLIVLLDIYLGRDSIVCVYFQSCNQFSEMMSRGRPNNQLHLPKAPLQLKLESRKQITYLHLKAEMFPASKVL